MDNRRRDRALTDDDVAAIVAAMEGRQCAAVSCRLTDDDVVFFKRLKSAIDTLAKGIGMAVILAIVSAFIWIGRVGIEVWRTGGGK